jgi:hypothetical protein
VLRLDLRWARLLRLAVATRVVRLVWDQLLACSSCGGGGGGGRYRRLGPPHAHGDVLTPVAADDDGGCAAPNADAADVEDVVGLKVSLLGDCQIGKTSFMVIINFLLCCPSPSSLFAPISWFVIAVMSVCPCFSYSSPTYSYAAGTTDLHTHFLLKISHNASSAVQFLSQLPILTKKPPKCAPGTSLEMHHKFRL